MTESIMIKILVAATFVLSSVSPGLAQQSTAMEIAQAREACGDDLNDTIISARFLEDGRVAVRCARPAGAIAAGSGAAATGAAAATAGAVSPGVLAGLFTIVLGAVAVGGSSSTSDTQ